MYDMKREQNAAIETDKGWFSSRIPTDEELHILPRIPEYVGLAKSGKTYFYVPGHKVMEHGAIICGRLVYTFTPKVMKDV